MRSVQDDAKVYIILLNYNGWRDTIECLGSLLALSYPNYQILVIDNDSPDGSMASMLDWVKSCGLAYCYRRAGKCLDASYPAAMTGEMPIVFIKSPVNGGFAAGNNIGIDYAVEQGDADYIWLLNNDTVVDVNALSALVNSSTSYAAAGEQVGVVGSKLLYYAKRDTIQAVGGVYSRYFGTTRHIGENEIDVGQYDHAGVDSYIAYPVGASMFVPIKFVLSVGKLSEEYFLYYEELDWVLRGKVEGWRVGYSWESVVYHKVGASIGSSADGRAVSGLADYYSLRSRHVFMRKFFPRHMVLVKLAFIKTLLIRVKYCQFEKFRKAFSLWIKG